MTTRNQHKAAIVAALYILDQAGALSELSQSEITRRLDLPHRSRISRALVDVRALRVLVPDLLERLQGGDPGKNPQ